MSKESLSLYAICKWWLVCINSDHEYNLKIQICQGKKGKKRTKLVEQSAIQTIWNSEVHSAHEAMQATHQDNESHCFALLQALLKSKRGVKGSQAPERFPF